jgi:hypothetical protein
VLAMCRDRRVDVECTGAKPYQIRVARAAHRPQQLEVIDRFKEVRLPLPVVADHHDALRGKCQIRARKIAKVANRKLVEARHYASRVLIGILIGVLKIVLVSAR